MNKNFERIKKEYEDFRKEALLLTKKFHTYHQSFKLLYLQALHF